MQPTHMGGKSRINKAWRLLHVYLFVKGPTEKDIMDIKLINLLTTWNCNGEKQPNNSLLNERTKSFRIINTFLLSKASSNQPSLITLNVVIYIMFDLVHPNDYQQHSSHDEKKPKTKCRWNVVPEFHLL